MNMASLSVIQPIPAVTDLPLNCTFDADDWMKLARNWYPVALSREVVDGPVAVKLLDVMNAASPVSAKVTRLFAPIARNFDTNLPVQDVYDFNDKIFREDKRIVEAQKPEYLPLDPRMEAHIMADRSSIAYRRGLRDMGLSRFFIA
jgi:hypothetical protein